MQHPTDRGQRRDPFHDTGWGLEGQAVDPPEQSRLDLSKARAGGWAGRSFELPLTHGRRYAEDEIWDNFTRFIEEVVPVAEEAGVRIGIHPDDPPVPDLGGQDWPVNAG